MLQLNSSGKNNSGRGLIGIFNKAQSGATTLEYGFMAALIAGVIVTTLDDVSISMDDGFAAIEMALDKSSRQNSAGISSRETASAERKFFELDGVETGSISASEEIDSLPIK